MARVSTHVLDSVSGKPAAGIRCQLYRVASGAGGEPLFDVDADAEGRIARNVVIGDGDRGAEFELVLHGGAYFAGRGVDSASIVSRVVLRFVIDDDAQRCHLPVMLAPHSYSTWWSG